MPAAQRFAENLHARHASLEVALISDACAEPHRIVGGQAMPADLSHRDEPVIQPESRHAGLVIVRRTHIVPSAVSDADGARQSRGGAAITAKEPHKQGPGRDEPEVHSPAGPTPVVEYGPRDPFVVDPRQDRHGRHGVQLAVGVRNLDVAVSVSEELRRAIRTAVGPGSRLHADQPTGGAPVGTNVSSLLRPVQWVDRYHERQHWGTRQTKQTKCFHAKSCAMNRTLKEMVRIGWIIDVYW